VQRALPLDLFAVMLGTNDLLGTLRPSAAKTAGMMNELLTFVKAAAGNQGKDLQILLIAPPAIKLVDMSYEEPYVSGDKSYTDIYEEEGRKLSQYYRELARYRKVLFADASEWPLSFAFDGVHLSEEGHAAFAQYMTEVLRQIPDLEDK
jgi:lysophospholipase L1-like esterase